MDKKPFEELSLQSAYFLFYLLGYSLLVWGKSWFEFITSKQIKFSFLQLVLFRFIVIIDDYTNYLSIGCVFVFFLALLTRTETNLQIIPIAITGTIILYTTLIAALGNIWEYWYTILKVMAIYCNHEYYGLINLTYFILITQYLVSTIESISSTQNKKQHRRGFV